jgi:phage gp46-like protein
MSVDVAKHIIIRDRDDPHGIPFDWSVGRASARHYAHTGYDDYCSGLVTRVELLESSLLIREDTLDSAVIMSLFCDARADEDTKLPLNVTDRRGWCGDEFFDAHDSDWGSLLWTRWYSKTTEDTRRFMIWTARQSLQHLIDNKIAERVEVTGEWRSNSLLALKIDIYKPEVLAPAYHAVWGLTLQDHEDKRYGGRT